MQAILNELHKINGLEVEVCGSWVWAGGDTKPHKEALKALGMKYSGRKCKWYWAADLGKRRVKGRYSMPAIRAKFGSVAITDEVIAEIN